MFYQPTIFARQSLSAFFLLLGFALYAQPAFVNKIPIPPLVDAANGTIELEMRVATHKFNPDTTGASVLNGGSAQPNGITTFCYNKAGDSTMTFLGPTLKWHSNAPVHIKVKNMLPQPTTTHWHGAEVPSDYDGGPHQAIPIGTTWNIAFPVLDYASTLWYHPHYHNRTVQQVQMGLSGMIIVEEPGDILRPLLPHTYGTDDIPVIIGDMGLQKNPPPPPNTIILDTLKGNRPYNLVNGVNSPYLNVPRAFVRLRILNGSTRKGIKFGFSKDPASGPLLPFRQVATDGGYTYAPEILTTLMNGPGSREEVVIDLSSFQLGDKLYIRNLNTTLPNSVVGSTLPAPNGGGDPTTGTVFLQLRVVSNDSFPVGYVPITSFPSYIVQWEPDLEDTTAASIDRYRYKKLVFIPKDLNANPPRPENMFNIDSTTFNMEVINDTVCVNAKEVWTIENTTAVAHPFHIHKIQFRILSITDSFGVSLPLTPLGFNGPKDNVLVMPGWKLRFMATFSDYPDHIEAHHGYMYHCHILTHEDAVGGGMMHQFVVTDDLQCMPSGAGEPAALPRMALFPNPSPGELYLQSESDKPSILRISDAQGRALREQSLPAFSGSIRIHTEGLPKGLFFVEWHTENGRVTKKMVLH